MDPQDSYLRSVFLQKVDLEYPPRFCHTSAAPSWDELLARITKAHYQRIEDNLVAALTERLGRPPVEADVVERCKKLIYPDGTVDYTLDEQVILRLLPPPPVTTPP